MMSGLGSPSGKNGLFLGLLPDFESRYNDILPSKQDLNADWTPLKKVQTNRRYCVNNN